MRHVQSNLYSLSGWQKVDKAGSYQIKVLRVDAWPEPKGDRTWSEILAIAYSWYSQRFSTSQQSWQKSLWALFEQLAFLMQTELFADYLVPLIELVICENVGSNRISSFCRTILLLVSIDSSRENNFRVEHTLFVIFRSLWLQICVKFFSVSSQFDFINKYRTLNKSTFITPGTNNINETHVILQTIASIYHCQIANLSYLTPGRNYWSRLTQGVRCDLYLKEM